METADPSNDDVSETVLLLLLLDLDLGESRTDPTQGAGGGDKEVLL